MQRARSLLALGGFAGATLAAAVLGARATTRSVGTWYSILRKPSWSPPRAAFGPVWTALYAVMTWSAWRVYRAEPSRDRTRALGAWGVQLALNAAWSPLFFGARRGRAALVDLGALLAGIGTYIAFARKVDRSAAWSMAPYAAWTGFAGALNAELVRRNPRWLLG